MPKLVVIPLHGISERVLQPGYSNQFFSMLVEELMDLGVIPAEATEKEIAQYIVREEVFYSEFGQEAENRVRRSYIEAQSTLFKPWDKILNAFFLEAVRRFLITAASDSFIYQNQSCRDLIRDRLVQKIAPYLKTGDAVSIVGHSLGAVVAFDTIYYNATKPPWEKENFLPSNLFTMGSPLLLFSLDLMDECTKPEQKARFDPDKHLEQKLIRTDGVWLNFLDPQDVLAYPIASYFKKKHIVQDIVVSTGIDPASAHSDYWQNREIVSSIAQRLKLDYARINATQPSPSK